MRFVKRAAVAYHQGSEVLQYLIPSCRCARSFLMFVNTAAVSKEQKIYRSFRILVAWNSSRVHKRPNYEYPIAVCFRNVTMLGALIDSEGAINRCQAVRILYELTRATMPARFQCSTPPFTAAK